MTMKVTILWHGGANYSAPRIEDAEQFDSLRDMLDDLEARGSHPYYPGAYEPFDEGEQTIAHVFYGHVTLEGDEYPDRAVVIGPRGGMHLEMT